MPFPRNCSNVFYTSHYFPSLPLSPFPLPFYRFVPPVKVFSVHSPSLPLYLLLFAFPLYFLFCSSCSFLSLRFPIPSVLSFFIFDSQPFILRLHSLFFFFLSFSFSISLFNYFLSGLLPLVVIVIVVVEMVVVIIGDYRFFFLFCSLL